MFIIFVYITGLQKNARVAQQEGHYSHTAQNLLNKADLCERQGCTSGEGKAEGGTRAGRAHFTHRTPPPGGLCEFISTRTRCPWRFLTVLLAITSSGLNHPQKEKNKRELVRN